MSSPENKNIAEENINNSVAQNEGSTISVTSTQNSNLNKVEEFNGPEEESKAKKAFVESDAGDGTRREDHFMHGSKLVLCILAIFMCLFLVSLDQTIVATIITTVGNKFNAYDNIGWLSSGFFLSIAVFTVLWGKLSVIFGRKYSMCAAIIIFEAGSLMCALANTMNVLIGGRVLAGVGGGGIQSLSFILISEVVPIEKRAIAQSVIAATFAIASVVGPLIGGAFTSNVSWRWCFYINLPIGGLAFASFWLIYNPPFVKKGIMKKLKMIDYIGSFLLTSGLVVFLLAIAFGSDKKYKWDSAAVICCFVIGGIVLIIFGIWNFRYSKMPLLAADVCRTIPILASSFAMFAIFGWFMSCVLYLAVYFQVVRDQDALHSGISLLPFIIAVVVASISTGVTMQKTRFIKPFAMVGAIIAPVGMGLLCLLEAHSSVSKRIGLLILGGVSAGMQMQPALMGAQICAPKTASGTIMSITLANFLRAVGGAIGGDLADAVYSSSLSSKWAKAMKNLDDPTIKKQLHGFSAATLSKSTSSLSELSPEAQSFVKDVVVEAVKNVFYMSIGFAGFGLIINLFSTNKRIPEKSIGAATAEQKKPDGGNEDESSKDDEAISEINDGEKISGSEEEK